MCCGTKIHANFQLLNWKYIKGIFSILSRLGIIFSNRVYFTESKSKTIFVPLQNPFLLVHNKKYFICCFSSTLIFLLSLQEFWTVSLMYKDFFSRGKNWKDFLSSIDSYSCLFMAFDYDLQMQMYCPSKGNTGAWHSNYSLTYCNEVKHSKIWTLMDNSMQEGKKFGNPLTSMDVWC